jgi:peroxiredoxin Q/BCP
MSELTVGAKAPAFSAQDQSGKTVSLSDFAGKKVVLFFYPKDDTPGCTTEACSFRDEHAAFKKKGAVVLGISPDDAKSHTKFIEKFSLPFTLIADEGHKIAETYASGSRKACMGKSTWASSGARSSSIRKET